MQMIPTIQYALELEVLGENYHKDFSEEKTKVAYK